MMRQSDEIHSLPLFGIFQQKGLRQRALRYIIN